MKSYLIPLVLTFLTACGSSGSNDTTPPPAPDYSGLYSLGVESITMHGNNGERCSDVHALAEISDNQLTADFVDEYGYSWLVVGDVLENGSVEGLAFREREVVAHFEGSINDGGQFNDVWGCSGVWLLMDR